MSNMNSADRTKDGRKDGRIELTLPQTSAPIRLRGYFSHFRAHASLRGRELPIHGPKPKDESASQASTLAPKATDGKPGYRHQRWCIEKGCPATNAALEESGCLGSHSQNQTHTILHWFPNAIRAPWDTDGKPGSQSQRWCVESACPAADYKPGESDCPGAHSHRPSHPILDSFPRGILRDADHHMYSLKPGQDVPLSDGSIIHPQFACFSRVPGTARESNGGFSEWYATYHNHFPNNEQQPQPDTQVGTVPTEPSLHQNPGQKSLTRSNLEPFQDYLRKKKTYERYWPDAPKEVFSKLLAELEAATGANQRDMTQSDMAQAAAGASQRDMARSDKAAATTGASQSDMAQWWINGGPGELIQDRVLYRPPSIPPQDPDDESSFCLKRVNSEQDSKEYIVMAKSITGECVFEDATGLQTTFLDHNLGPNEPDQEVVMTFHHFQPEGTMNGIPIVGVPFHGRRRSFSLYV